MTADRYAGRQVSRKLDEVSDSSKQSALVCTWHASSQLSLGGPVRLGWAILMGVSRE